MRVGALAVQALHMLVDELEPEDTVSLVVYAGAAGAVAVEAAAAAKRKLESRSQSTPEEDPGGG